NIDNQYKKDRAQDELPQSSGGKTIMTTEPKFVPEEAVVITFKDTTSAKVRLIDCVGYIVPSSVGYIENETPRMISTPWYNEDIPFNLAAEIGTQKVINEHSTIGLVITTDGSFSEIPREEYKEAEERVISELKDINKPFVIVYNCKNANSQKATDEAEVLRDIYNVPVVPVNCMDLNEEVIKQILSEVLNEFPVKEISINMPKWVTSLDVEHWLRADVYKKIYDCCIDINHISQVQNNIKDIINCKYVNNVYINNIDLGSGTIVVDISLNDNLFYEILGEATGIEISDESQLMPCMIELAEMKKQYEKVKAALDEVEATGYGIVMPSREEMTLEEPQMLKQGGKYGVRLKASAPSIHMMRADIEAEVAPIVGNEKQSEELVTYLLKEFEENPNKIWESNIFGKSLHELVSEGLHNKIYRMPSDARLKMQETIERIINEGCAGLICIII
ncbi:MAG: stage IV sporulation protein A, partial [Oscillospiraceae bacterium]